MKRNLQNLLFKIQGILHQAKINEFEDEDEIYIKASIKEWNELVEILKGLK